MTKLETRRLLYRSASALVLVGALVAAFLLTRSCTIFEDPSYSVDSVRPTGTVTPHLSTASSLAIMLAPDGSLWTWGGNEHTKLQGVPSSQTTSEIPLRIGDEHDWVKVGSSWVQAAAIKADGTLWAWGYHHLTTNAPPQLIAEPIKIGIHTNWADISSGASHFMALKSDNSLWVWGQNNYGQVGDGTTNTVSSPIEVAPEKDWSAISTGHFNSYAIARNGSLWGWGLSGLGGGRITKGTNNLTPTLLDPATDWLAISAGNYHLAALKNDRTLWIRGQNAHNIAPTSVSKPSIQMVQLGKESDWTLIRSGEGGFVVRKNDGTWWTSPAGPLITEFGNRRQTGETPDLTMLADDFDPWTFGANGTTIIVLNRDGRLWSVGWRLGTAPRFPRIAEFGEIIASKLGRTVNFSGATYDQTPHLIWEFDPSE